MDLSKRTILHGTLFGFFGCVIASLAIGNSQRFEGGAIQSLLMAGGYALLFVPPIAIAFHTARTSHSQHPFLLSFLSGSLGGAIYAIFVAAIFFSSDVTMILGSATIVFVLSAVGALVGLLVRRNGP